MESDFDKQRRDLLKSGCSLLGVAALVTIGGSVSAFAVGGETPSPQTTPKTKSPQEKSPQGTSAALHKYVIERDIPHAGSFSAEKLQGIAQKSCGVLTAMGPEIQWVESYVTDDKIYCVYIAANEQLIREHAKRGGFPADRISEVGTVIDPTTAG